MPDRRAAYGTSSGNQSDIGNAVAGSCATSFVYRTIRVRVEAATDHTERVLAFFPDTGAGVQSIPPGGAATFTPDKGVGHCLFEGPTGELEISSDRSPARPARAGRTVLPRAPASRGPPAE